MAEGEGFEPSIRLPAYTLSKRAPSATRPPLHRAQSNIVRKDLKIIDIQSLNSSIAAETCHS